MRSESAPAATGDTVNCVLVCRDVTVAVPACRPRTSRPSTATAAEALEKVRKRETSTPVSTAWPLSSTSEAVTVIYADSKSQPRPRSVVRDGWATKSAGR